MLTTDGIAFLAASAYDAATTLGRAGRCTDGLAHQHHTAVAALAGEPRQQVGPQRGDDEQHRDAQRAGLREQQPELAEHSLDRRKWDDGTIIGRKARVRPRGVARIASQAADSDDYFAEKLAAAIANPV
jgi:hypothetical protein